jgi:CO dehydrogenase/acetyl-CoA synthase beta subunit
MGKTKKSKFDMNNQAVDQLLEMLPTQVYGFDGSEYPMPLQTTFLGHDNMDISQLRTQLDAFRNMDEKELLKPLLLSAEIVEASCEDKSRFFITDAQVREYVFMGSKWSAGWVLVLGTQSNVELIDILKEKGYYIFTDCPDIDDTFYIGNRATSPIYFLQMMVRYGLIWGRIAPGDDHEMGHFLEKDMPGFMIITEDLDPLKYLISLGIMKLGAPALVPSTFPFPYGMRIVTDEPSILVKEGVRFPNLRMCYYNDEIISLPDGCNSAYVNEDIKEGITYGGLPSSFFFLRSSDGINPGVHIVGSPSSNIGIIIEIENSALSNDLTKIVEQTAMRSINYLPGVKAAEHDGSFYIKIAPELELDCNRIGELIYCGIRLHYPGLEKISITFIFDQEKLEKLSGEVRIHKDIRRLFIQQMTEQNTDEFCACNECRPFSLEHTCILTPDRIPMCASRTYFTTKAESLFGTPPAPFRRQSDKDKPLKLIFSKGKILNPDVGEYEGCNLIYSELTSDRLNRVYLHSLRGFPHTSCGCFQNLAFWMEEVSGIGIMSRGSKAVTPNGKTWDILANHAGGKQSDGIMGVSLQYIRSKNFLKGDGGIGNVVWVDQELYKKISDSFLPEQIVATENNVTTIDELKQFINR